VTKWEKGLEGKEKISLTERLKWMRAGSKDRK